MAPSGRWRRLAWFMALWAAGVMAIFLVTWALRAAMGVA